MNTFTIVVIVLVYFGVLMLISYLTSKNSDSESFFTGNKKSPWYIVAYGMIGAALSGVTFVSLPGSVASNGLHFGQMILGNIAGYFFITFVLIPMYYKMNLVSIYTYLETRFGKYSYKTGTLTFIISQSFGAALRMLLAIKVFDVFMPDITFQWNGEVYLLNKTIILSIVFIALIYFYTQKSGIKTIVWTDTLQTTFLIGAAIIIAYMAFTKLGMNWTEIFEYSNQLTYTKLNALQETITFTYNDFWDWDWNNGSNFFKQFIGGALIAIAMMGLDQNMMQKSLTIKNRKDAQKNTLVFSVSVGLVQLLFLVFGLMLYVYASKFGIELPKTDEGKIITDEVFPYLIKSNQFGTTAIVLFILGITAAAFSSADSALTALTTSFCYDFLKKDRSTPISKNLKTLVHIHFSILMLLILFAFSGSNSNIFGTIFSLASYTYAPLLGIYLLGIFTHIKIRDWSTPIAFMLTPIITYFLDSWLELSFFKIFVGACITITILLIYRAIPMKDISINK